MVEHISRRTSAMATTHRKNRNHSHKNKREFSDLHEDVRLDNCFFIIDDGRWTDQADVAIAAQRAGHTVQVVPKPHAIGRLVPPEEWTPVPGDPPHNLPSD
jgi:hypothetical protein